MKLSDNFTLEEMILSRTAVANGIDNTPPAAIVAKLKRTAAGLEQVRALLGQRMLVQSGYRCPALNRMVGGAPASQHLTGEACDFIAPEFGVPLAVAKAIEKSGVPFDQLIHEFGSWVHVSFVAEHPRGQTLTIDRLGTRSGLLPAR